MFCVYCSEMLCFAVEMFSLDSRAPLHRKNIVIIFNNLHIIAKFFHGVVDRPKKDQVCLPYYARDLAFVGRFAMGALQLLPGPRGLPLSRQAIVEANKQVQEAANAKTSKKRVFTRRWLVMVSSLATAAHS